MTITEDQNLTNESTLGVDDDRTDADQGAAVTDDARPGCVFTAALRHRIERTGVLAVPAPPHVATFGNPSCEQFWSDWAERVRAAVVSQSGR